ncbi:hypothetical protein ACFQX6_66510 [Streptosporangium lutulentum]
MSRGLVGEPCSLKFSDVAGLIPVRADALRGAPLPYLLPDIALALGGIGRILSGH